MHLHRKPVHQWSFLVSFDVYSGIADDLAPCEPLLTELDELASIVSMGYPVTALTALDGGN